MRPQRWQPTRLPRPWDSPGKNTGVGCHFLLQCMKVKMKVKSLSRVRLPATLWTAAYQAPPSMGFSRQEYWSGVPLPSPLYIYIYILLKYSWLAMFQVHSKVIQLYKYTYIIFEIIFHHRLLQDINYNSLDHTVNLCCLLHIYFLIRSLAFYSYWVK